MLRRRGCRTVHRRAAVRIDSAGELQRREERSRTGRTTCWDATTSLQAGEIQQGEPSEVVVRTASWLRGMTSLGQVRREKTTGRTLSVGLLSRHHRLLLEHLLLHHHLVQSCISMGRRRAGGETHRIHLHALRGRKLMSLSSGRGRRWRLRRPWSTHHRSWWWHTHRRRSLRRHGHPTYPMPPIPPIPPIIHGFIIIIGF